MRYTAITLILFPLALYGQCDKPENTLFSCNIGFESDPILVEICLIDATPLPQIEYSRGDEPAYHYIAKFTPDINEGGYLPWQEEGFIGIQTSGGKYSQDIVGAFSGDHNHLKEAYLNDMTNPRGNMEITTFCETSSIKGSFDPLWQKLEEAGWRFIVQNEGELAQWVHKGDIK